MAGTYSSSEATSIIEAAGDALQRIADIKREQESLAQEVVERCMKLIDERGNSLAKSYPLVRTSSGQYRTPTARKHKGTKSNLYLATMSGEGATIMTRTGSYDARRCYERVLATAGLTEDSDAFRDLVYAAYKKRLHQDVSERSLREWESVRSSIQSAMTDAEPAKSEGLARLFMKREVKETAFSALDALKGIDVGHIARNMESWPEYCAEHLPSRDELFDRFRQDDECRQSVLGTISDEVGSLWVQSVEPRPFSSAEAQHTLDQLQGISEIPAAIEAARAAVEKSIPSALDSLRESDIVAALAKIPIEELSKAKTGAQVKKLRQAGVVTLGDLYARLRSPEAGALPGVGSKTGAAIMEFLSPQVLDVTWDWRPRLSADERTDAATLVVRTAQAYLELTALEERSERARAHLGALGNQETEDLRYATDQIDWLLADDERARAATNAMRTARDLLDSRDGAWMASLAGGSKVTRLQTELVPADRAWKAFSAHPEEFDEVIEKFMPEAPAPPAPAAPEPAEPSEAQGRSQAQTGEQRTDQQPDQQAGRRGAEATSQGSGYYDNVKDVTMLFSPVEDTPVFDVASKYSVNDGSPRVRGNSFSLAIPDGWVSLENPGTRPFALIPKERASEGADSDVEILCGLIPGQDEYASTMGAYGSEPVLWAFFYYLRSEAANFTLEMHEVQARNCCCAVVRVPTATEGCWEFYVYPYSLVAPEYVRITFYEMDEITYEQARTFVDALARTVEADDPTVPASLERLEERGTGVQTLEALRDEALDPVVSPLTAFNQMVFNASTNYYKNKVDKRNWSYEGTARSNAGSLNQYFDVCAPLVERVVDLLRAWAGTHPFGAEERETCDSLLQDLVGCFVLRPDHFDDFKEGIPDLYREIAKLYNRPTPTQQALLNRIAEARAALGLPRADDVEGEPDGAVEVPQAETKASNGKDTDLVTFFLTLLSQGWVFFRPDIFSDKGLIEWDGSHHSVSDVHLEIRGARQMDQLIEDIDAGFDGASEVADYLVALLTELEKDDGLRVPRSRIARGVQKALPKGPLTGITLANLCESSRGLTFKGGFDRYQVFFDTRLSRGIPQFFSLVAQMLWDLRACMKSLSCQPFDVLFLPTRSLDADLWLGDVDEPVADAQDCPGMLHVTECPEVVIPTRTRKKNA